MVGAVHTCVLYSILWLGSRKQKPDKITQSSCFMKQKQKPDKKTQSGCFIFLWKGPGGWRQEQESWKREDS